MIAADAPSKTILLGECKWRNNLDETETIEALRDRVGLVRGFAATHLAVFTKKPLSKATRAKYPNSSPNQSMSCIARCSCLLSSMCSSDSGLLGNTLRRIVCAATHPARRDRDGRVVVLFRFVAEFGLWNVALFALSEAWCPQVRQNQASLYVDAAMNNSPMTTSMGRHYL